MKEPPNVTYFSTFQRKREKKKCTKKKYEEVDWKPERVAYAKGEQKKEHEGACKIENLKRWSMQKLKQSKMSVKLRDDLILLSGGM